MAAKSHFKLNRDVKIDGIDFEAGIYAVEQIDSGRRSSIVNAGWGDYCDAPKSKSTIQTSDDDETVDVEVAVPPKPARSRARAK